MSRYQVLRTLKIGVVTSLFISFMNYMFNVTEGRIVFMTLLIEYDIEGGIK